MSAAASPVGGTTKVYDGIRIKCKYIQPRTCVNNTYLHVGTCSLVSASDGMGFRKRLRIFDETMSGNSLEDFYFFLQ